VKTKVTFLVRLGDNVNDVRCGAPIIFNAIDRCIQHSEPAGIVKLLLENKADVRFKLHGCTPLVRATTSECYREDLCRLLIDNGAKKREGVCQQADGSRPRAFDFDDHRKFKTGTALRTYLTTMTGNPDAPQLNGYQLFAPNRKLDEIKAILEQGVDVNTQDEQGRTPLFYATGDAAYLLMQNGADPCVCDNNGFSALSFNRDLRPHLQRRRN
jgi:ankyrin repeat protein